MENFVIFKFDASGLMGDFPDQMGKKGLESVASTIGTRMENSK